MRSVILASVAALFFSACATEATTPAKPAEAAKPAVKTPQCYSTEHGKFFDAGMMTKISGIDVVCEKTSDGKSAQWMGKKK